MLSCLLNRVLLFSIFLTFTSNAVYAGWEEKVFTPRMDFNAIDFVNSKVGWAVGDYGAIYKTTDGGLSWNGQLSNFQYNLVDVDFYNENYGVAVCDQSYCLSTTNGGETWKVSEKLSISWFGAVRYADPNHIWVTGEYGIIHFSSDAGQTWAIQKTMGFEGDYYDISAPSPNLAFMVGDGAMFKTTNGGQSWSEMPNGQRGDNICFVDENYGWISYYGSLQRTTDGGQSWSYQNVANEAHIVEMKFFDRNNGLLMSRPNMISQIFRTTDGGENWIKEKENDLYFYAMSAPNPNFAYFIGNTRDYNHDIAHIYKNETSSVEPQISTNTINSSIDFGIIDPGTEKSKAITISNLGLNDLVISSIEIVSDARNLFNISNLPNMSITLHSEQTINLNIDFSNTEPNESYNSTLRISSNSITNPILDLNLLTKTSEISSVKEHIDISSSNNSIELSFKNLTDNHEVYIYNSLGEIVYNNKSGSKNMIINTSVLPLGVYFIKADNTFSKYLKW